jgi:SOS-response transcriptional repressor LexA
MRIKQKKRIVQFLRAYIASNGEAPLIREIKDFFGYRSTGTVHEKLVTLERDGWIRRSRRWRGIEVLK